MTELFALYRYISRQVVDNPQDTSYALTLQLLEPLLDLLEELEQWGQYIKTDHSINDIDTNRIATLIIDSHKIALCTIYGNTTQALLNLAGTHLNLHDYDTFIELLQAQKAGAIKALEADSLGDLDNHPF